MILFFMFSNTEMYYCCSICLLLCKQCNIHMYVLPWKSVVNMYVPMPLATYIYILLTVNEYLQVRMYTYASANIHFRSNIFVVI